MAPAWVRPFVTGVLATAIVTGGGVLATRPRHDTIEVLIATPAPSTIAVAVSGEVARPGVYELASGSRVHDLLVAAGGPGERADPAVPSRALLLRDEMHIHVPAITPVTVAAAAPTELVSIAVPAILPTPTMTAPTPDPVSTTTIAAPSTGPTAEPVEPVDSQPVAAVPTMAATSPSTPLAVPAMPPPTVVPAARPATSTAPTGLINLNTASTADLERLPGIGPALAGRIVADRQQNGPFGRVDDLDRVPGIGPAILARIRPLVSV